VAAALELRPVPDVVQPFGERSHPLRDVVGEHRHADRYQARLTPPWRVVVEPPLRRPREAVVPSGVGDLVGPAGAGDGWWPTGSPQPADGVVVR
jgi:hypothetical protein